MSEITLLDSSTLRTSTRLSHTARTAIEFAAERQLEHLRGAIEDQLVTTFDECSVILGSWRLDETIILDMDLDDRLSLLEMSTGRRDFPLGEVTIGTLRRKIEVLTAQVVSSLGATVAQETFGTVVDLLEDFDAGVDRLKFEHHHGYWRHFGEYQYGEWLVYQYRNLEGEGLHLDLFELHAGGFRWYFEHWLEKGSLSVEEEQWEAT